MPRPHQFVQKMAAGWPGSGPSDVGVLVAVSGGADSVALLRAMHERRGRGEGRLAVAHFNHRLRGGQSDADEQFVVELCGSLGLDCHVGRAEGTPIESAGDGLEATARAGRYAFLRQTAERIHARYVVTAHTADDQAETILHHVMRGTGLAGLAGIARVRPLGPAVSLVRPLLDASRAEVIDYLSSLDQPFCQDATNDDWQFTRNRIRHELLPLLARDYSPGVVAALVRLGALARDAQDVLEAVGEASLDRSLVESDAARLVLDCRALDAEHRHVVREMLIAAWRRQAWPLQAMGSAEWNLLADMALSVQSPDTANIRKQVLPGAITAERRGERLVLQKNAIVSPH